MFQCHGCTISSDFVKRGPTTVVWLKTGQCPSNAKHREKKQPKRTLKKAQAVHETTVKNWKKWTRGVKHTTMGVQIFGSNKSGSECR